VQNPAQADNRRTFYVHHWPQPGLLPRDPARCATLRNIAYFGMFKQLPPALQAPEWPQQLRALGLDWVTPGGSAPGDPLDQRSIHDYRTTDVVVALRDPRRTIADHKPPTKLLNAWLAGVPAIVGPESAYRALRTDALDFIEAADADAVLAALRRLQADPELYAAMSRRARTRAAEVAPEAIAERWRQLLTVTIPAQQARAGLGFAHRLRSLACHGQRCYLRLNRHRFRHYDLP
jgi:glycosyltransferase involved in cell wall biosynthesis